MTKYIAIFENGKEIVKTSEDFKNRLEFFNWICTERLGTKYGRLIEINAAPYIK